MILIYIYISIDLFQKQINNRENKKRKKIINKYIYICICLVNVSCAGLFHAHRID